MSKRNVFLRGLFVVGLVAVLCAYGLATEQSANENQGAANQNQATAQPGTFQPQAPSRQGAQAMMLVRTHDLIGKEVRNTQGDRLGRIRDIVLTPDYQSVSYVALSTSPLAIGGRLYAVPWHALHIWPAGEVTMSVTKDQLTQAPGFPNSHWPSQADPQWSRAGTPGAAATAPSAAGSSAARPMTESQAAQAPSSAAVGQTAAGGQDVQLYRVTHLTGAEVKNTDVQDLGEIAGFAIDVSNGHVVYDIISVGGVGPGRKYVAVPPGAIRMVPQNHVAILNASRQMLESVAFRSDEWPNWTSPEYMQRLSKLFPPAPPASALGYLPSQTTEAQRFADEKAWGVDSPQAKAFDRNTVTTITGTVDSIGSFKAEGAPTGAIGGLRLDVKTSNGQTVIVYAGPLSFAEQKDFFVMPGDQITITGSQTNIQLRSVLLASELKKDGQTLALRDKSGKPLWGIPGTE
jgi:sporulation protein YlmC with PRC-barrel domain